MFKLLNISSIIFAFLFIVSVISAQQISFEQRMHLAAIDGARLAAASNVVQKTPAQKLRANTERNRKVAFLFSGFTSGSSPSVFNVGRRRR